MGGRVARGPRHAVGLEPVGESLIRGARRDPCDVASGRRRVLEAVLATVTHLRRDFLREEFLASSTGPGPGPAVDDASRVVSNIVSSLFMYKAKAATTRARDLLSFFRTRSSRASSLCASIGCDFIRFALCARIVVGKARFVSLLRRGGRHVRAAALPERGVPVGHTVGLVPVAAARVAGAARGGHRGGGGGHRVLHLAVWVRRVGGAEAQVPHFAPQHDDERAREEQQDLHAQQEPGRAVVVRVGEDAILYREDEGGGGGAREGQRGDGRGCPRENPRRRRGAPELNASSEALPRWCLGRFAHVPLPDRFASPTG